MERPYKIKPPKDLADYIIRSVADHTYLIVDRKADRCRCTRCGADSKISEMYDEEVLKHKDEEAIGYEVTITAAVDASGNSHYEYIK